MPLIQTAESRDWTSSKVCVLGKSGVGKTSLARSVTDPLVIDCESGVLALRGTGIPYISVIKAARERHCHPFSSIMDLVCLIAGPSPNVRERELPFSREHYDYVQRLYGERESFLAPYATIFIDSLTEVSRLALDWARRQPGAKNPQGKPDLRAAYGLLGQHMVGADGIINRLRHVDDKSIVIVGILEQILDDGGTIYQPQVEGTKTSLELTGIFDLVLTMADLPDEKPNKTFKALVCQSGNPWGFPAKDRSGQLDMLEPPDLGHVMRKAQGAEREPAIQRELPASLRTSEPERSAA